MRRALALALVAALGSTAVADGRHVMVLHADGNADAATRAKVDAEVLRLAKAGGGNIEAGDISYADAATAAGCNTNDAGCKDEVLGMLGVDEIVTVNASSAGGKTTVVVRRAAKTGPAREAHSSFTAGQDGSAQVAADVGSLFGVSAPPPVEKPAPAPAPTPAPAPAPAPTISTAPLSTNTPEPTVTAAPNNQVTPEPADHAGHRRLEIGGMIAGGSLVLLGIVMWAEAASTQNDINNAPVRTSADFTNLKNLESTADGQAGLGNVLFIGGVVLGGVSGYFFWRDHRAASSSQQARLAPAVFDHGAGVALTIGGAP